MPKLVLLWTDLALLLIVVGLLIYIWHVRRSPALRATWGRVTRDTSAMCAAVVLALFALVAMLDSIHYRPLLPPAPGASPDSVRVHAPIVRSALDALLDYTTLQQAEKTYSAPLATRQFNKETLPGDGPPVRDFPRLRFGGAHLGEAEDRRDGDVMQRLGRGLAGGALVALLGGLALVTTRTLRQRQSWRKSCAELCAGRTERPWRGMWLTFAVLCLVIGMVVGLSAGYHVLGTDRTGNDVLWQALKSIRTAVLIGSLTTLAMLPPALIFGISAGYFKGRVDDVIQYLYTTLTSIPGILLVAACVLMMQVYIDNNPDSFPTSAQRADLRLLLLCLILGFTGWAGLCRLLRAETLKLRELDYVQAARAFGVSHWRIMTRHLLPNVMHIVLITAVLEFSGLVLYEAVLSYLGIGVDPTMNSFGSMIDMARTEMSRDPMIWWNLSTAFIFMVTLVLAANLFADAVRDAFDPRSRRFRAASPVSTAQGDTP